MSPGDLESYVVSLHGGGAAQRMFDPACGAEGCGLDDEQAEEWLDRLGARDREQELRDPAATLVAEHWAEIEAVASELLIHEELKETEVELIAERAAGDETADVEMYRRSFLRDKRSPST